MSAGSGLTIGLTDPILRLWKKSTDARGGGSSALLIDGEVIAVAGGGGGVSVVGKSYTVKPNDPYFLASWMST